MSAQGHLFTEGLPNDDVSYFDAFDEILRDYDPFAHDLTYMARLERELTANNILKQNIEIMRSNLEKVKTSNERLRTDLAICHREIREKDARIAEKDRILKGKQSIIVGQGEIIERLNRQLKPTQQFVPARKRKQDLKKKDAVTTKTVAKQLRWMVVN